MCIIIRDKMIKKKNPAELDCFLKNEQKKSNEFFECVCVLVGEAIKICLVSPSERRRYVVVVDPYTIFNLFFSLK